MINLRGEGFSARRALSMKRMFSALNWMLREKLQKCRDWK
jgi:hypothetical protein